MERRAAGPHLTAAEVRLGLIADTHGLVRPAVHRALAGVQAILHAGDVGGDDVLAELALIAPVHAVGGNTDPPDHPALPPSRVYRAGRVTIHVSHGHELGAPAPQKLAAAYPGADVLVYGHTHQARVERIGSQLIVNPGAAGPARFDFKPSVAVLRVVEQQCEVEVIEVV